MIRRILASDFVVRLAVALAVVTVGYILIFHPSWGASRPHQPVAAVRSSLDEVYLTWNALANADQTGTRAEMDLPQLRSQLAASSTGLTQAAKRAGGELTPEQVSQIQTITSQVGQESSSYDAGYRLIGQLVTYDPQLDLGQLSIPKEANVLAQRAEAAKQGLTAILAKNSQPSSLNVQGAGNNSLISSNLHQMIATEISCLGQLSSAQAGQLTSIRAQCISQYPPIQTAALQAITAPFRQNNLTGLQDLLRQLGSQTARTK